MEEAFSSEGRTLLKGRMVAINGCSFSVLHNLMPYPADVLHAFLFYAIMGCMSIGSAGKSGKDLTIGCCEHRRCEQRRTDKNKAETL